MLHIVRFKLAISINNIIWKMVCSTRYFVKIMSRLKAIWRSAIWEILLKRTPYLIKFGVCLVHMFKHMFSVFKQYYMYFYILFSPTRISKKKTENCYLNTRTKQATQVEVRMCLTQARMPFFFSQLENNCTTLFFTYLYLLINTIKYNFLNEHTW